jgi:hypothetical protein
MKTVMVLSPAWSCGSSSRRLVSVACSLSPSHPLTLRSPGRRKHV